MIHVTPYGFVPASFGAAATPTAEDNSYVETMAKYAPIVKELLTPSDARQQAAVLEAKIKNYKAMREKIPALRWFYDNEITKMRAKLVEMKKAAGEKAEEQKAVTQWRTLGQTAVGVGIVAGVGLVVLIMAGAVRLARGRG